MISYVICSLVGTVIGVAVGFYAGHSSGYSKGCNHVYLQWQESKHLTNKE